MRIFEGTVTIKWHKNDYGKTHPLTIDCQDEKEFHKELKKIKDAFLSEEGLSGYNYEQLSKEKKAYSVTFNMTEKVSWSEYLKCKKIEQ